MSSTLVGSETMPLGDTPLNTPISAKKRTAATTLRLAWSHPLLYPVHPVRRHPTTRTLSHKFVLTPRLDHQSSIYVPYIGHNDLAHIPDLSSCCQAGLSICHMSRPPNHRRPFQSLVQRLQPHRQCRRGRPSQPSPQMTTSTQYSFAPSRTDFSPPSPTAKPMPLCSSIALPSESRGSKTKSSNTKKPSNEPQRVTSSTTGASPTSTSHAAKGFPARLSGSSSTTMARCRDSWTPTDPNQPHISPIYTPKPMTNTLKRAIQGLHSPCRRGSASFWWAPQSILLYSTMPSLITTIGDSPAKSTVTATSITNSPTPASNSNKCRSTSMRSVRLAPLARLASCLHAHRSRSTNSRTFRERPRPRAARGSISLMDMVVQSSGGIMLPALRSPACSDLPRLM